MDWRFLLSLPMPLEPKEIARYQRHLALSGFGLAGQEKLKRGSVLVIGAGGLGCPALLYLVAAGVGRIVIVDDDRVEVSNLQRQVLFTVEDTGQLKAHAAARRLMALNPGVKVEARAERFSRQNALELVRSCDVVIDGTDNFPTRYLVNDACVLAGRPFVYGAIQGFEGQLSVFNWRGGPTYRCLFPTPPAPGTIRNCAEAGVLGVLPGLIGTAQACEAIKLLAEIGEPLSGRLLLWDALSMATQSVKLSPREESREITELPGDENSSTSAVQDEILPEEIDAGDLRAAMESGRWPQLLDVREGWERAMMGVIEPSVHIPLGELAEDKAAVQTMDPALPTVVYCAAGVRSLAGADVLRDRYGFRSVTSLRGGIKAWLH